ncbi:ABC transporter substrate-binding protein [Neptunomonas phycophila]|nr:GGDEF domain-containing protein [Neptunomonas phycophila]MDO6469126.1 ABC transporter substrate-binding protein [Neptunomonas phycophila]
MTKRFIILFTIFACCFVAQLSHGANQEVSLQLRWSHQAQFIGYYVAKEKGFYESLNLDVTIKAGGHGIIPWQEIKAGRSDFAVDNSNAFTAYIEGEPIISLAAIFQHSPSIFLSKSSSGIRQPRDLVGKRVMAFPGSQDPELILLLLKQGIALEDVNLIATSADLNDLITDKVDAFSAYISNEPYYLQKLNINFNIISPKQYGIDFYSDVLITNPTLAQQSPELVDRFISASLEGWRYALNHPEEAINILYDKYNTQKEIGHLRYELNLARELIMPDLFDIGHMNPKRWEIMQDTLLQYKLVKQSRPVEDFIYNSKESITWSNWLPIIYPLVALVLALTILSFYLISLNRKLKKEIRNRIYTETQLKHLANHDPLTGLANRSALTNKLDTLVKLARRNKETPALLYIDLDGFKEINDTHGHSSGDQVLIRFAKRTRMILRESDIFARLGGDEFVILLSSSDRAGAHHLARKILLNFKTPFKLLSGDYYISASIGIAIYDQYDEAADQFLIRADHAMYHIKRSGKSGISIAPAHKRKRPLKNVV